MYLHSKLEEHKENIDIALIGCGKFISMFLSQYNQLKKIRIDTIVDLDIRKSKIKLYEERSKKRNYRTNKFCKFFGRLYWIEI